MVVDADPTAGTVTIRLSTAALALRGVAAVAVGLGAPLLAELLAPALLVPALLLTAGAAAVVVLALGRVVVLDDHGVTLGSARRTRPLPWAEVDALVVEDGRIVVVTRDGRRVRGPRCDEATLASAREDAVLLGLLATP